MTKKRTAIVLSSVIVVVLIVISKYNTRYQYYSRANAIEITSDKIISLNNIEQDGFTCTGAVYDPQRDSFYVGDAGKTKPEDAEFRAVIRELSRDMDNQFRLFECYKQFSAMRDIQGVTIDNARNIWFCSYGENLVYCIDQRGNLIESYELKAPSGITYDSLNNAFWVLTDRYLISFDNDFKEKNRYFFRVQGQDQLFFDSNSNMIYITAGNDYHSDSYVYTFDINHETFELKYILKDAYAIEGISIVEDTMYIFNDGFYHAAEIPLNQVNIYFLH